MGKIQKYVKYAKVYPHILFTFIVILFLIISLVVLLLFRDNEIISSISANIFAGLLTGLIVTLIGSLRNKSIQDILSQIEFCDKLRDHFLQELQEAQDYWRSYYHSDDKYLENVDSFITEMGYFENLIEEGDHSKVLSDLFGKKPSCYFSEKINYSIELNRVQYDDVIKEIIEAEVYGDQIPDNEKESIHRIVMNTFSSHQILANHISLIKSSLLKRQNELNHLFF